MRLFFFAHLPAEEREAIALAQLDSVERLRKELESVRPEIEGRADRFQYLCFQKGIRTETGPVTPDPEDRPPPIRLLSEFQSRDKPACLRRAKACNKVIDCQRRIVSIISHCDVTITFLVFGRGCGQSVERLVAVR